jgi:hypothetical protein
MRTDDLGELVDGVCVGLQIKERASSLIIRWVFTSVAGRML